MNQTLRDHLHSSELPSHVIEEVVSMFAEEADTILSRLERYDTRTREVVAASIHEYYMVMNRNTLGARDYQTNFTNTGVVSSVGVGRRDAANDGNPDEVRIAA